MAFPTTSVLDDFNRADSSSLGANWTYDPVGEVRGEDGMIAANMWFVEFISESSSWLSAWWNPSTFGFDSEVYCTIGQGPGSASGDTVRLYSNVLNPPSQFWTGFELELNLVGSQWQWRLWEFDAGSGTQIGATYTATVPATGDSIGMEVIGTAIKAYHMPSGDVWAEVMSRTHSGAVTAAGYIAAQALDAAGGTGLDDFGGGSIGEGPPPPQTIPQVGVFDPHLNPQAWF